MRLTAVLSLSLVLALVSCSGASTQGDETSPPQAIQMDDSKDASETPERDLPSMTEPTATPGGPMIEVTTLGAGCFWCIEAVLEQIEGVTEVRSGYMGGALPNPTYTDISTGTTGHAEVVEVSFDTAVISFEGVLDHFWKLHDPTTLNRQGADVGTQYRSAIFYHSEEHRKIAEASKAKQKDVFVDPVVTEITEAVTFYEAENYHQDYYRLNKRQPYCRSVIAPKLKKLGLDH